jgi:NADPH:quinone reductase-like Zn-dependent oxidoreductase
MKAAVYTPYKNPVGIQVDEVERPSPKENEVVVKVAVASVNALDWRLMKGSPSFLRLFFGLTKPKAKPGRDVSGVVESVGSQVTLFKPGDEVFGTCMGAFAEHACAKESDMVMKPAQISFEAAACLPIAGLTALQGLRDRGRIEPGQKVLIDGAGGGVGTFAVQLAKYYRANVTATCGPANVELMGALGADHVLDYSQVNVTQGKEQYDLILAANGYHAFGSYKKILAPRGTLMVVGGGSMSLLLQVMTIGRWLSKTEGRTIGFVPAKVNRQDLEFLSKLAVENKLRPVVEKVYPLNEACEAVHHVARGHTRGKVVILIGK